MSERLSLCSSVFPNLSAIIQSSILHVGAFMQPFVRCPMRRQAKQAPLSLRNVSLSGIFVLLNALPSSTAQHSSLCERRSLAADMVLSSLLVLTSSDGKEAGREDGRTQEA